MVARLFDLSRAEARRLLDGGEVRREGSVLEPTTTLRVGDVLEARLPPGPSALAPEEVGFEVRYEDEHLVVVDKPAGVVVHPGAGRRSGTLAAGLLGRWPELEGVGEKERWGLVHRLDRETSGLLLVARTPEMHLALRRELGERRVERRYLALVHGTLEAPTGTIDAPMGRDPTRPTRMAIRRGGRPARTHYRLLAAWELPPLALLEITLETGRTHQVRVHLASIGHPLVGDRTYGRAGPEEADPGRVWLHAARLAFTHPVIGAPVEVASPLPAELRASLDRLGSPARGTVEVL